MEPCRILFVDDDEAVLRALGDYFERLDYEVHRAASGEEGLATWKRVDPSVIVLDLFMPGMNGIEVLQAMHDHRAVVLMLTAFGDIETAVQAMQLGAENFLTKPIDMDHLVQAVEKASEKAGLRLENRQLMGRLRPSVASRIARGAAVAALIALALFVGRIIGNTDPSGRTSAPIPIPIETVEQP